MSKNGKSPKVKFREELISFEPELTDDDVNSIESDYIEIKPGNQSPVMECKTTIFSPQSNIFKIEEKEDDDHVEDEIIEEILDDEIIKRSTEYNINSTPETSFVETFNQMSNKSTSKSSKRKIYSKPKSAAGLNEVHCKQHCIDKLECDLSMSIKKLKIH